MKVIAKTSGGYLVEVDSLKEMPSLCGFEASYNKGYSEPSIGEEINTTKFFRHILSVISAQEDIKKTAADLASLAGDLGKITLPEIFNRE